MNKTGIIKLPKDVLCIRERITDTRYGSEYQTKKNELAWMGIEAMAFELALRRSNHWDTETAHLNHHIQLRYHPTADNVLVAWLFSCSDPKLGIGARVRYSRNAFTTMGSLLNWANSFFLVWFSLLGVSDSLFHSYCSPPYLLSTFNFFPFMEGQLKLWILFPALSPY